MYETLFEHDKITIFIRYALRLVNRDIERQLCINQSQESFESYSFQVLVIHSTTNPTNN